MCVGQRLLVIQQAEEGMFAGIPKRCRPTAFPITLLTTMMTRGSNADARTEPIAPPITR